MKTSFSFQACRAARKSYWSHNHIGKVLSWIAFTGLLGATGHAAPSPCAWTSIGPKGHFGVGETHGRVRSIHIQPFGGGHYVYIGASGGGLWRADGLVGPEWQSLGENLPNPSVGAFAVHPLIPDDILVGTGDFNRYQGGGMFHTTDGGQTWTSIALPIIPGAFFRVHYLPGNLNTMVAATDAGLFRSASGPDGPWQIVLGGQVSDLILHPSDSRIQFASRVSSGANNDGGIYKSIDSGQTWTQLTTTGTPTNLNNFGLARIAICRDQPNVMAFVYEWGVVTRGVRKSVDGGMTWTDITGTVGLGQTDHTLAIAIRPNNPSEILVGANNIFRSVDGGQTWVYSDNIKPHQDQTQLYFNFVTGDNVMWECNDGGIFRVDLDANTWVSWNGTAAGNLSISTIADMDARGGVRAAGFQDDGAAGSGDSGASWTGYSCCDVYNLAVTDVSPPTFWYNNQPGGPTLKQVIGGGEQDVSDSNSRLINLATDPFSSKVYGLLTDADGLPSLVSRPFDASGVGLWTREATNLPAGVTGIAVNPLDGQTIYLWNSSGVVTVMGRSAGNWGVVRVYPVAEINWAIGALIASPSSRGEVWAGIASSIAWCGGRITLGGQTRILHTRDDWQHAEALGDLPSAAGQITGMAVSPSDSRQLFVSTDRGVYCSQDGGNTWQAFQTGLPASVYCTRLKYVESLSPLDNDKLVLATCGRGMYERELPRGGIVYVDQRNNSGMENGTREHPFNTLIEGINATSGCGTMALNGATIYQSTGFTKPMTITAYEFPAQLRP
jgi:photosystem II stability/assembly factor-like uncharacterized protein